MTGEEPSLVLVLGPDAERLRAILESMASPPRVRLVTELYLDAAAILEEPPAALWIDVDPLGEEDLGALRLLRRLLPAAAVFLTATAGGAHKARRIAAAIGAKLVARPFRTEDVVAAWSGQEISWLQASEGFPDLARGLADEIGNPLHFASGYLQLLAVSTDRATDAETAEKLDLVRIGIDRIGRSVQKLRLLAGSLKPVVSSMDPMPLIAAAVERARTKAAPKEVQLSTSSDARHEVLLDPEQFALAMDLVLETAVEVAQLRSAVAVSLLGEHGYFVLRFSVGATALPEGSSARLFEPYALTRHLRGSETGLNLALARAIMAAHGAGLRSHATPEGALVLEFLLPLSK